MTGTDDRPSAAELYRFVENDLEVRTQRLAFPAVDARRTNGHVQGIAAHFPADRAGIGVGDGQTMYASLSNFPGGWGACLIESSAGATGEGLEAMAIPQGEHAGGINVCDGILAVPMEHPGRQGRLYLYDLEQPLYPVQIGHLCEAVYNAQLPAGHQDPRYRWPTHEGGRADKASAAAIARIHRDLTPYDGSRPDEPLTYLVAVLHENRYLRFFVFDASDRERLHPITMPEPATMDARIDVRWPSGRGTVVDNISLLNTDDGLHLVAFSSHGIWPFNLPRRKLFTRRSRSVERVSVYKLDLSPEADDRFQFRTSGDLRWAPDHELRKTEWFWPSFRWGASMSWTGDRYALFVTEYFGDESWEPDDTDLETAPAEDGEFDGHVQYLQFASTLDNTHFGKGRDDKVRRQPAHRAVLGIALDGVRFVPHLLKHQAMPALRRALG